MTWVNLRDMLIEQEDTKENILYGYIYIILKHRSQYSVMLEISILGGALEDFWGGGSCFVS